VSVYAELSAEVRTPAAEVQSSSDVAYREIKASILTGAIALGMRLGEERIAERLSVSRTPVREALLRLYAERFLERHPEGGFRVNHPTGRSIRELYGVRLALELFAIRETVGAAGPAERRQLEELRAEWSALAPEAPETDPDFVLLDEDFHCRLAEASGNVELVKELRRLGERIRPVRTHDFVMPGRIDATIAQHLRILDAVLARADNASERLERHILESLRIVQAAVGIVLERMLHAGEDGAR
jgi:DNA-binding GntR family transcriptional regulator